MNFAMQFDPYEVLGVSRSASLSEIRDAYRARSKTHHPDAGGDAWAFRVLTRSYELVSTARVMGRANEETSRESPPPAPPTHPGTTRAARAATASASAASGEGRARAGAVDGAVEPARRIAVEMLLLRYQVDDLSDMFSAQSADRNLSCSLNIQWPPPGVEADGTDRVAVLPALAEAVEATVRQVRPTSHKVSPSPSRYVAWLSYTTAVDADRAFQALRKALKPNGLGVQETIREISIPRDWSE